MKTVSRPDAKTPRPFGALRLCVSLFLVSGAARAADLARVDALLVQAQALLNAARTELAAAPDETPPPVTGRIDLASFAWAGKKTADPTGLPAGARYGEGVEGGKRFCQWTWPEMILHAVMPAGTKSATGKTVTWYHFTRTAAPFSGLSAYHWRNTHQSEGWYRWAGAK